MEKTRLILLGKRVAKRHFFLPSLEHPKKIVSNPPVAETSSVAPPYLEGPWQAPVVAVCEAELGSSEIKHRKLGLGKSIAMDEEAYSTTYGAQIN
jgi:hypothetical protein